jgi:glycopeptide antibiotics resistance protein
MLATELLSNDKVFRNLRNAYLIYTVAVIFLGLASRKYSHALPIFLAENAGDALWAMMVYFGFRFLLVRKPNSLSILFSILFSFGIEFSQMYQAGWINQIRSTWLGALVLGKGFLTVDLIRYTVGILLAAFWDQLFLRPPHSSK